MKQGPVLAGFVLGAGFIWASPLTDFDVGRNTSLVRRAPTVITLDCDPKLGKKQIVTDACANACYYINCRKGGNYVAKLQRGNGANKRIWSGCNIKSGTPGVSVCNKMPFAQQLNDYRFEKQKLSCDEFPMAVTEQVPWDERKNLPGSTNSLRCAIDSHNSNAGRAVQQQLKAAKLQNGDEFTFKFENADSIPYCLYKRRSHCDNLDWAQFELTDLKTDNGKITNPYDWKADNTYRVSGQPKDIDGLFLTLIRTQSKSGESTDITYDLTIKDRSRTQLLSSTQTKKDQIGPLDIIKANDGLYADMHLAPITGARWKGSVFGAPMEFFLGEHFSWNSNTEGVDDNSPLFDVGTKDKHYCKEISQQSADTTRKELKCYFPTQRI